VKGSTAIIGSAIGNSAQIVHYNIQDAGTGN
jgi:hypothetical protein